MTNISKNTKMWLKFGGKGSTLIERKTLIDFKDALLLQVGRKKEMRKQLSNSSKRKMNKIRIEKDWKERKSSWLSILNK